MDISIESVLNSKGLEPDLVKEILAYGRLKKVSEGRTIISSGDKGGDMPFVISGLLKVMRQDNNGNELFLYYLEGGETCAMSITCCLEGTKNAFHVMAEDDSVLWMVPTHYLDGWIVKYPSFRLFVFKSYQERFDELLSTIDSVTFMKMDQRLYKYLLDKKQATGSYIINNTHEQIATALSTSRVVISRLLKQLEREEKIEQGRNRIEIL
jgi:CRP/FNR family transcriptional regulator